MLFALVSAKGSPGVTTTALTLAAAAGQRGEALCVEADPSGGDVECWCGPLGEPGLLAVATDLARDVDPESLSTRAVEAMPGVRVIAAPTSEAAATATLVPMVDRFAAALASLDGSVFMDCGRWSPMHRAAGQVAGAALVGVVCRPTLDSIEHARGLVEAVRRVNRSVAAVVVGGIQPYGPDEVAEALGVPVVGVLPWDPRGVLALLEGGAGRGWQRSALGRSSTTVSAALVGMAAGVWADA